MTDSDLTSIIVAAFMRDSRLSSQPINVSVHQGMVTLIGAVQTYRRKLVASEIAASFHDCRGVVNELVVEPPDPLRDEEVADLVRLALESHADITKPTIAVSVKAGIATLSGEVGSAWEQHVAEDVTLSVGGVRDVRNLLIVDSVARGAGETLSGEIEAAMSHVRGLQGSGIRAAVVGESVILSGKVKALWQSEAAESVVYRFGFFRIRNEIVVAPPDV